MNNEIEQLAQKNDMSIEFVTWFFNEKKANCGNVWFMMMAAMWEGWKGRIIEMDKLATENAALKDINAWCKTDAFKNMYREFKTAEAIGCSDVDCMHDAMLVAIMHAPATSATDRIVAGIKADGVEAFALMFAEEAIKDNDITTGWKARASRAASEYAELLREGCDK